MEFNQYKRWSEETIRRLKSELLMMSMSFRAAEDLLRDQRDELQREKNCKDVIFLVKDFSDVKEIAKKIDKGPVGVLSLSHNQKLYLKFMTQKRKVGDSISGLLDTQNSYGHSKVTKSSIQLCKDLAMENNVFEYFKIKGTTIDIIDYADTTKCALKTVECFVRHNPNIGSHVNIKYGKGVLSWRGKYRGGSGGGSVGGGGSGAGRGSGGAGGSGAGGSGVSTISNLFRRTVAR